MLQILADSIMVATRLHPEVPRPPRIAPLRRRLGWSRALFGR